MRRQCVLLGLSRSSLYYQPATETADNLRLLRLLDEEYTAHPFLGSRRLTKWLVEQGEAVNRKRIQRLLRLMGLEAIYPKPKLSAAGCPSESSLRRIGRARLPPIFCQTHASSIHTVPTTAPPKIAVTAPCQPAKAPMATGT